MKKLVLYIPPDEDPQKIDKVRAVVKDEAGILGLDYEERMNPEDYLMVYYEDDEISTFLYIEDEDGESMDNIRMMIRVLALIAMNMEKREEVYIKT